MFGIKEGRGMFEMNRSQFLSDESDTSVICRMERSRRAIAWTPLLRQWIGVNLTCSDPLGVSLPPLSDQRTA